jgi:hypothetical protein
LLGIERDDVTTPLEWHLGKVFSKLGIRSRRELAQAIAT